MTRTCHYCDGESEDHDEANLRRCAGCQKVYYCSKQCQKDDWACHIFDCKPNGPINTAYHLARAVRRDLIPDHPQTCEDYGFNRTTTARERTFLFGLYVGLFKVMSIPPKTVHDWRVRGVLVDEIKNAYYKIPEKPRGGYFPWFLQNQHIVALAGQPLSDEKQREESDGMILRGWRFIGGSERESPGMIRAEIAKKSVEEQQCFWLYVLVRSHAHPCPSMDLWLKFGFASCPHQWEEMSLGEKYFALTDMCTFDEFCDAYRGRRLLDLFHSKGLRVDHEEHFRDLLHAPGGMRKSAWDLKQLIVVDAAGQEASIIPPVWADYGFMNCENEAEIRQLKRVYKAFFEDHNGDPLALHEASIKGNLHGFLSKSVQGLRDPKFRRLMRNLYPLPDL